MAGLRLCGLVAQKAFDRPINAASFEEWVEKCLVSALSKGDIVVMDNLSSHKGPRVEQLIKAAGAELRYLPPYSPDMNPIEKAYSKLKAFLRKIAERTVAGLLIELDACADIFTPEECVNYFGACGYDTGSSESALGRLKPDPHPKGVRKNARLSTGYGLSRKAPQGERGKAWGPVRRSLDRDLPRLRVPGLRQG